MAKNNDGVNVNHSGSSFDKAIKRSDVNHNLSTKKQGNEVMIVQRSKKNKGARPNEDE